MSKNREEFSPELKVTSPYCFLWLKQKSKSQIYSLYYHLTQRKASNPQINNCSLQIFGFFLWADIKHFVALKLHTLTHSLLLVITLNFMEERKKNGSSLFLRASVSNSYIQHVFFEINSRMENYDTNKRGEPEDENYPEPWPSKTMPLLEEICAEFIKCSHFPKMILILPAQNPSQTFQKLK